MIDDRPRVPCQHCGVPTPMTGTRECDNCHEIALRLRMGAGRDVALKCALGDEGLAALRTLRLWHWRQLLNARANQVEWEKLQQRFPESGVNGRRARQYAKKSSHHLGAVQALNSVFPVDDTAERDAEAGA